jgi:hypothetical protein
MDSNRLASESGMRFKGKGGWTFFIGAVEAYLRRDLT